MQNLGSLSVSMEADLRSLQKSFTDFSKSFDDLFKKLETSFKNLSGIVQVADNIGTQLGTLATAAGNAATATSNLATGIGQVGTQASTASSSITKVTTASTNALNRMTTATNKAASATAKTAKSTKEAQQASTGLGGALSSLDAGFTRMAGRVAQINLVWKAFNSTLRLVGDSVRAVIAFDQGLKNIQAITLVNGQQLEKVGQAVRSLARDTTFSAAEVADALTLIGQAGFSVGESMEIISSVTALSIGTLTDLGETVKIVTTVLRAYNLEASDSAKVADILVAGVNSSKLSLEGLNVALNFAGPAAAQAGLSLQQTTAALGTLANNGIKFSTQGTGLRQVIAALISPTDKVTKVLNDLGISVNQVNPLTRDFGEILRTLRDAGFGAADAFQGFERRTAAALAVLVNGTDSYQRLLKVIDGTSNALIAQAAQLEGLDSRLKLLKQRFQDIFQSDFVRDSVKGLTIVIDTLTTKLSKAADIFGALADVIPRADREITLFGEAVDNTGKKIKAFIGALTTLGLLIGASALFGAAGGAATGVGAAALRLAGWSTRIAALGTAIMTVLPNIGQLQTTVEELDGAFASLEGAKKAQELLLSYEETAASLEERLKAINEQDLLSKFGAAAKEYLKYIAGYDSNDRETAKAAADAAYSEYARLEGSAREIRLQLYELFNEKDKAEQTVQDVQRVISEAARLTGESVNNALASYGTVAAETQITIETTLSHIETLRKTQGKSLSELDSAQRLSVENAIKGLNELTGEQAYTTDAAIKNGTKFLEHLEEHSTVVRDNLGRSYNIVKSSVDQLTDSVAYFKSVGVDVGDIEQALFNVQQGVQALNNTYVNLGITMRTMGGDVEAALATPGLSAAKRLLENNQFDAARKAAGNEKDALLAELQRLKNEGEEDLEEQFRAHYGAVIEQLGQMMDRIDEAQGQYEVKKKEHEEAIREESLKTAQEQERLTDITIANYRRELDILATKEKRQKLSAAELARRAELLNKIDTLAAQTQTDRISAIDAEIAAQKEVVDELASLVGVTEDEINVAYTKLQTLLTKREQLTANTRADELKAQADREAELNRLAKQGALALEGKIRLKKQDVQAIKDGVRAEQEAIDIQLQIIRLQRKRAINDADKDRLDREAITLQAEKYRIELEAMDELIRQTGDLLKLEQAKALLPGEAGVTGAAAARKLEHELRLMKARKDLLLAEVDAIEAQGEAIDPIAAAWGRVADAINTDVADALTNLLTFKGGFEDFGKAIFKSLKDNFRAGFSAALKEKLGFDKLFKNNMSGLGEFVTKTFSGAFNGAFSSAGAALNRVGGAAGGSGSLANGAGGGNVAGVSGGSGFLAGAASVLGPLAAGAGLGGLVGGKNGALFGAGGTGLGLLAAGAFPAVATSLGSSAFAAALVQAGKALAAATGLPLGSLALVLASNLLPVIGFIIGAAVSVLLGQKPNEHKQFTKGAQGGLNKILEQQQAGLRFKLAGGNRHDADRFIDNILRSNNIFVDGVLDTSRDSAQVTDALLDALVKRNLGSADSLGQLSDVLAAFGLVSGAGISKNSAASFAASLVNQALADMLKNGKKLTDLDLEKLVDGLQEALGSFGTVVKSVNETMEHLEEKGKLTSDSVAALENSITGAALIFADDFPKGIDVATRALALFRADGKLEIDKLESEIGGVLDKVRTKVQELSATPIQITLDGGSLDDAFAALTDSFDTFIQNTLQESIISSLSQSIIGEGFLTQVIDDVELLTRELVAGTITAEEYGDAIRKSLALNVIPGYNQFKKILEDTLIILAGATGLPIQLLPSLFGNGSANFLGFDEGKATAKEFSTKFLELTQLAQDRDSRVRTLDVTSFGTRLIANEKRRGDISSTLTDDKARLASTIKSTISKHISSSFTINQDDVDDVVDAIFNGQALQSAEIRSTRGRLLATVTGSADAGLSIKTITGQASGLYSSPVRTTSIGISENTKHSIAELSKVFQERRDLVERFVQVTGVSEGELNVVAKDLFGKTLDTITFDELIKLVEDPRLSDKLAKARNHITKEFNKYKKEFKEALFEVANEVSTVDEFAAVFSSASEAFANGIVNSNQLRRIIEAGLEALQDTLPGFIDLESLYEQALNGEELNVDKLKRLIETELFTADAISNSLSSAIVDALTSNDVEAGVIAFGRNLKRTVGDFLLQTIQETLVSQIFVQGLLGDFFEQIGNISRGIGTGDNTFADLMAFISGALPGIGETIDSMDGPLQQLLSDLLKIFSDSGFLEGYNDAINAQDKVTQDQLAIAQRWQDILERSRELRADLLFGPDSPANILFQLDQAQGALDKQLGIFRSSGGDAEKQQNAASQILDLVSSLFGLGQSAGAQGIGPFQQTSLEYQRFVQDLLASVTEVQTAAEQGVTELDLLKSQLEVLNNISGDVAAIKDGAGTGNPSGLADSPSGSNGGTSTPSGLAPAPSNSTGGGSSSTPGITPVHGGTDPYDLENVYKNLLPHLEVLINSLPTITATLAPLIAVNGTLSVDVNDIITPQQLSKIREIIGEEIVKSSRRGRLRVERNR